MAPLAKKVPDPCSRCWRTAFAEIFLMSHEGSKKCTQQPSNGPQKNGYNTQSRRAGSFGGLSSSKQSSKPPNWNMKHYKLVEFLSDSNVNPPCTIVKPPRANVKPPIDDIPATVLTTPQIFRKKLQRIVYLCLCYGQASCWVSVQCKFSHFLGGFASLQISTSSLLCAGDLRAARGCFMLQRLLHTFQNHHQKSKWLSSRPMLLTKIF